LCCVVLMLLNIVSGGDGISGGANSVKRKRKSESIGNERKIDVKKEKNQDLRIIHNETRKKEKRNVISQDVGKLEEMESFEVEPVPEEQKRQYKIVEKLTSDEGFDALGLSGQLVETLIKPSQFGGMGFEKPTLIQEKAIPALSEGRDVLLKSQTGSGKTLAFGLPIIDSLAKREPRLTREDGLQALILTPTRELCFQVSEVLRQACKPFYWILVGSLLGGEKRKSEKARLRKGVNVLIATPGRLIDHLKHTKTLSESIEKSSPNWLVLDEADRLTDPGFSKQLEEILDWMDEKCVDSAKRKMQTVLCSATLSKQVKALINRSLKDPVVIEVETNSSVGGQEAMPADEDLDRLEVNESDVAVLPSTLMQHYVIVESKDRLSGLSAFILRQVRRYNFNVKIVLFVSCRAVVEFLHEVLSKISWPPVREGQEERPKDVGLGTRWWKLHGSINQEGRRAAVSEFSKARHGVLICTDVAARGLDLPFVDWIIQYDPPSEVSEYIHRVGRTARSGRRGSALLFLAPQEEDYLKILRSRGVKLSQMHLNTILKSLCIYAKESGSLDPVGSEMMKRRSPEVMSIARRITVDTSAALAMLQIKLEDLVSSPSEKEGSKSSRMDGNMSPLKILAEDAFVAYIRAYAVHSKESKMVFQPKQLHFGHVARSFALREPPKGASALSKSRHLAKAERKEKRKVEKKFDRSARTLDPMMEFAAF